jgi:hypothetical protein
VEEDLDVVATKRVANRAMVSSVLTFFGVFGAYASSFVLSPIVSAVFVLIVLGVAISSIRTLLHPDAAYVMGGIRWLGISLCAIACLTSALTIVSFSIRLLHSATN